MHKLYLFIRFFPILLILLTTVAWSQSKTVSGKVTAADDGSALPGVNILEKGTSNGSITSVDGTYSITVNENAVLAFSFVGYQTVEIQVGTQATIDVNLQSDVTALSEVVVIGYGEVRKRDATGAVASVKSEDFNVGVISSPEQLIQGKSAGVQITSASGEPGAGVNIRIRGTSSVRGGNNPLFVIDGIPLTGADVSAGGLDIGRGTSTARNPLNFINPSDIESIDILKDASATAIYGSRGANGVVIITTKSGKGKKRQVEYSTTLNISRQANTFDLLDRDQFLSNAARLGADVDALDYGANTDWQEAISRTSLSHRHDLSFSNNHEDGNYRVSLSYDDQEGVIKNSSLERITGRLNLNQTLFDKLSFGAQLTFSRVNDQAPPITNNAGFEGDLLGASYMANPTWPRYADSQFSNTNANPLAMLKYSQDNTGTDRALINLSLGYDILPGLNFKVNTGFDRSESTREGGSSPLLFLSNGVFGNGRAFISDVETSSDLLEAFFNYQKTIGQGSLTAVLGYSYQEFNRKGENLLGWGFSSSNLGAMVGDLNVSSSRIKAAISQSYQQFGYDDDRFFINSLFPTPGTLDITERPESSVRSVAGENFNTTDELQSFFGRLNYSLSDKYILTATFRADGSTRFGGDNKYGYFPSGAFAWRLSEEEFVPDFFDDLKLRLGYGITGNQEIPHNLHQRRQRYASIGQPGGGGLSIENGGNINPPGLTTVAFDNDNLKWEQTSQANVGLDFSFLETKLGGSIDLYRKVTTDLLIQITSAQPAPQPFTWQNLDADVINSGVEVTLNYYAIDTENTNLNFGVNVSYNKNEVKDFDGIVDTGTINGQGLSGAFAQRIVGDQPLYAFYLREFLGFDRSGLSIYNGDFQRFLGKSPIPKYNLGFSINLRCKNWDMSTFLTGQFGHYVYNNTANAFFSMGSLGNGRNVTEDILFIGESNLNAPDVSDRFLEKGDFLRMQNLVLGYNFNLGETQGKKLRVFASGQNLFVLSGYSGLDPEVNINKAMNDVPSLGIDYVAYPRARTLTLGLNVTF